MFDSGGSVQSGAETPGVLSGVPETEWTSLLRDRHAAIAREQFLEVDAIASVYLARCADDARRGVNEAFQGEFADVEVGVMLTVTEPTARRWIGLGLDLRWRLHGTSEAFATGRIDQARAQAISDAMANVSPDRVEQVEQLLLDGIDGATTSTIRRAARRLIARHDPAGAKARREQGEADRDIRFRANDDGTCSVEGTLPGPAGQVVAMRLRKMCFDVCAGDPRTFAQRRADALVALADGTGRLHCRCGRGDCPRATRMDDVRTPKTPRPPRSEAPPRPTPTGPPTPASPAPAIPVPAPPRSTSPDVSELADSVAAAERANSASEVTAPEVTPDAYGGVQDRQDASRGSTMPPLPPATVHVGVNVTTLLGLDDQPGYLAGHGWIDADLARTIAADGTWRKVLTLTDSDREAILDALCAHAGHGRDSNDALTDATLTGALSDEKWLSGRRIDTRSHGSILGIGRALAAAGITPTAIREHSRSTSSRRRREQLTYRPSLRVAEIVRARDGICRFPACTVRAIVCDLDHIVPFDHARPESGGWTIEQNLACLCRRHHRLKTIGRWKVRQLGRGRLEWTTPTGELVVTEPAGEFSSEATPRYDAESPREARPSGEALSAHAAQPPREAASPSGSDVDLATELGVTLTESAVLRRLFGQPRGRGAEDDLKYILDVTPAPIAVIDASRTVPVHDVDRPLENDDPPPF